MPPQVGRGSTARGAASGPAATRTAAGSRPALEGSSAPALRVPRYIRYRAAVPPLVRSAISAEPPRWRRSSSLHRNHPRPRFSRPGRRTFGIMVLAMILLEVLAFRAWQPSPKTAWTAAAADGRMEADIPPGQDGPPPAAHPLPTESPLPEQGATENADYGQAGLPVPLATDTPQLPPTETPLPPPTWTPGPEAALPVVPLIDGAMKARLRAVHQSGIERGLQPKVFAKVGDSISQSAFFLTAFGCGFAALYEHTELAPAIEYFSEVTLPDPSPDAPCSTGNSFTRRSRATGVGWSAAQVLAPMTQPPGECPAPASTPLACELLLIRPAVALVMFGTNEAYAGSGPESFRAALGAVVDALLEAGVIPLVSTIPPQQGYRGRRVPLYNGVVVQVAQQRQVPLVNYWRALAELETPNHGLAPDGIHPSAYAHGASLGPRGLRFGYNVRNLVTLQALAKIRGIVLEDGPPD